MRGRRAALLSFVPEIHMLRPAAFLIITLALGAGPVGMNSAGAQSESEDSLHYISDVLVINIRDKVEKPNNVVGIVRTGDSVRVLEEMDNSVKIETADSKQGWIAKQFIKKEPPDALLVKRLQEELSELKNQLKARGEAAAEKDKDTGESEGILQQKLSEAEKQILQLQEQIKKAAATGASFNVGESPEQDEELSARLEETSQRYNQLIVEFEKRGQEIAELHNSIAKHDDTTRFLWFGAGAVVFFLGILAGKSATRKKNKFLY